MLLEASQSDEDSSQPQGSTRSVVDTSQKRKIIVHYHLFKNAGSSVDHLLKDAYGEGQWLNHDPGMPPHMISANELLSFIQDNKQLKAMSSHMLLSPLPKTNDISICPIVFLREPITRVMSAYLFEWQKQKGRDTPCGTLAEYIESKFENSRASAIEDFQCLRFGNIDANARHTDLSQSDEQILQNAKNFLQSLDVFGLVDRFPESMQQFERIYGDSFPEITFEEVALNTTQNVKTSLQNRFEKIRNEIGSELYDQLIMRNQLDIKLYQFASGLFAARQS